MYLGIDRILELVNDPDVRLVENLSDRELNNPEGTGLDLRIGKLSRFSGGEGFLGVTERQTPEIEVLADIASYEKTPILISPSKYFLATTMEVVNMPINLVGLLRPRGSLFRAGIILMTGQINPGYKGTLTFGFYNASDIPFQIELGARIVHLLVAAIDGSTVPYRGQWQGGRINNSKREEQI